MVQKNWPKDPSEEHRLNSRRVFGWFPSLKKAKDAVELDGGFIYEYLFNFAVIEKIAEGLHGGFEIPLEWWYEWERDHEKGHYLPIDKPEALTGVIGFSMG